VQRLSWYFFVLSIRRNQQPKAATIYFHFYFISGNPERVAVPLNGPGGRIAILELKKGGRLPDGPLAAYFNTCKVLDFAWDPFNNHRLAVGMATDHYFFFND
jgi:hypothetical protein